MKYLGTNDLQHKYDANAHTSEVTRRKEIAVAAFVEMRELLVNGDLSQSLRIRMVQCYIFSTLFYDMERRTQKKNTMNNLAEFEMWVYRRMLKILWIDQGTNDEVMHRIHKEKEVLLTIKQRKLKYFNHITPRERYTIR